MTERRRLSLPDVLDHLDTLARLFKRHEQTTRDAAREARRSGQVDRYVSASGAATAYSVTYDECRALAADLKRLYEGQQS